MIMNVQNYMLMNDMDGDGWRYQDILANKFDINLT